MERPLRFCESCKQVDDHPRHTLKGVPHHIDCGAAEGCEACMTAEAEGGGRRGQELVDHLASLRGN